MKSEDLDLPHVFKNVPLYHLRWYVAWQLCFLCLDEIENHEIITDDMVFIEHYFKITFFNQLDIYYNQSSFSGDVASLIGPTNEKFFLS